MFHFARSCFRQLRRRKTMWVFKTYISHRLSFTHASLPSALDACEHVDCFENSYRFLGTHRHIHGDKQINRRATRLVPSNEPDHPHQHLPIAPCVRSRSSMQAGPASPVVSFSDGERLCPKESRKEVTTTSALRLPQGGLRFWNMSRAVYRVC